MRASMHVTFHPITLVFLSLPVRRGYGDLPTRYFFAGGRARSPCLKSEAYFSFEETKLSFTWVVDMLVL